MSVESLIGWCDSSWNPVTGCDIVSKGCLNCYAKVFAERFRGVPRHHYENGFDLTLRPDMLSLPLRWGPVYDGLELGLPNKKDHARPRRIFVNSMSDLFHEDVPDGYIVRVLLTMANSARHRYLILTKRIERACDFLTRWADLTGESAEPQLVRGPEATRKAHPSGRGQLFAAYLEALAVDTGGVPPAGAAWPTFDWMEGPRWWPGRAVLPNVMIGPTVEDAAMARKRMPVTAEIHRLGWQTMVSYEPALEAVDFEPWLVRRGGRACTCGRKYIHQDNCAIWEPCVDWLICGAESGTGRREFKVDWAYAALSACRIAGVPFYMKQDSAYRSEVFKTLPDDLKVREYPAVLG